MPPRKSVAEKKLSGTFRPSREQDSLAYSLPTERELRAPSHLNAHGKRLWKRLASLLREQSLLQAVDMSLLSSYCSAAEGFMAARESLKRDGYTLTARAETRSGFSEKKYRNPAVDLEIKYSSLMASLGAKLGFSPKDRELLTSNLDSKKEKDTSVEDYLSGREDEDAPVRERPTRY